MNRTSASFWRLTRPLLPLGIAALAISMGTVAPSANADGPGAAAETAIPSAADDRAIAHVLNRLGFGPRPGDLERVRAMGLEDYVEEQLHPEQIDDREMTGRLAAFQTLELSTREIIQQYWLPAQMERRRQRQLRVQTQPDGDNSSQTPGSRAGQPGPDTARPDQQGPERRQVPEAMRRAGLVMAELGQQKLLRAVHSERQLQEVLVDFWFNHFNVFARKGPRIQPYLTSYERDAIRPHVLGKFRDLLGAVAESPAMLIYLDNWLSSDPDGPDPQTVMRLRQRGMSGGRRPPIGPTRFGTPARGQTPRRQSPQPQPRRRGGLNENYARELLELHTLGVDGGYTQQDVVDVARAFTGWTLDPPQLGGGFRFEPRLHDSGEKQILGQTIEAGGGKSDGEQVLDMLARHPSTAQFIAMKLARRFVADDPPSAVVARAAATFRDTDGDLREVVRAIVTSPEFLSPEAYEAKVKTPLEFVVSAVRATGARTYNAQSLVRSLRELGMPPYLCQPPTGYDDTASAWINTGALLSRMNFAIALVNGGLRGVRVNLSAVSGTEDPDDTREWLLSHILLGAASAGTTATLNKSSNPVQLAVLAIGAPEFQRR